MNRPRLKQETSSKRARKSWAELTFDGEIVAKLQENSRLRLKDLSLEHTQPWNYSKAEFCPK